MLFTGLNVLLSRALEGSNRSQPGHTWKAQANLTSEIIYKIPEQLASILRKQQKHNPDTHVKQTLRALGQTFISGLPAHCT